MRTATLALTLFVTASVAVAAQQRGTVPPVPADVAAPPADAQTLPSGLASKVITPGTSDEKALPTDVVTVHYTGWTSDGKMFDSTRTKNQPATFPLNRVILGWRECVSQMTIGETRRCWLPESVGYKGVKGRPQGTTVFDIELVDTRRSPNVPPPDVKEPPADAKRTATGLAYKVLRDGVGGRHAQPWSKVTVHYTGWTTDGKMFDSSVTRGVPATLSLEDVVKGWTEGIPLMVEGERTRFWIPENLAYKGEAGKPKGMLVFDVDLVRIEN